MAAMALYAALVAVAAFALFAAAGWPRHFPELALPLLGTMLVAAAVAAVIARRLADTIARPLREVADAAWSGVEGRLRPTRSARRWRRSTPWRSKQAARLRNWNSEIPRLSRCSHT